MNLIWTKDQLVNDFFQQNDRRILKKLNIKVEDFNQWLRYERNFEIGKKIAEYLVYDEIAFPEYLKEIPIDKLELYSSFQMKRNRSFSYSYFADIFGLSKEFFLNWRQKPQSRSPLIEEAIKIFLDVGIPFIDQDIKRLNDEFVDFVKFQIYTVLAEIGITVKEYTYWKVNLLSQEQRFAIEEKLVQYHQFEKKFSQEEIDNFVSLNKIVIFVDGDNFGTFEALKIFEDQRLYDRIVVLAFYQSHQKLVLINAVFPWFIKVFLRPGKPEKDATDLVISAQIGRQIALNPNLGTIRQPLVLITNDHFGKNLQDQVSKDHRILNWIDQRKENLIDDIIEKTIL